MEINHAWVITSRRFVWMWLLIHDLIPILVHVYVISVSKRGFCSVLSYYQNECWVILNITCQENYMQPELLILGQFYTRKCYCSVSAILPGKSHKKYNYQVWNQYNDTCSLVAGRGPPLHHIGNTLQWRHDGCDGVSNHQPRHCLLNRLFRRRSKETSKLRAPGLCEGNSPVTGEFPTQMTSNAENVSIWWRHHENSKREL